CGLGHASGFPDGPPENVGMAHGDPVAAYHAAFAALVALRAAERDGCGQYIDMSQWETMLATAPEGVLALSQTGREPPRQGNRDPFAAPHGYFRCRDHTTASDDRYIAIAVETDTQWQALRAVMGGPAWSAAPELQQAEGRLTQVEELERRIEAWTQTQDAEALEARLCAAGVPAALVATVADLATDEHLAARGFFERIVHPQAGDRRYVGVPFKLMETPARLYRPAPLFGGDSAYVLAELLGLSKDELRRLEAAGALH
ncbi:MAG TPA: CoA transferase, partial [Dehalococcoidia bacterium]